MPEINPFATTSTDPKKDRSQDRHRLAHDLRQQAGKMEPGKLAVVLPVPTFQRILELLES